MSKLLTENVREILQSQYPDEKLVEHNGVIYHIPDTAKGWSNFAKAIGYRYMQESYGSQNHVVYDPDMYMVLINDNGYGSKVSRLKYKGDGRYIKLPYNSSTCRQMFENTKFKNNEDIELDFDTRDIVDMDHMFSQCIFEDGFTFGDKFITSNVNNMSYMFEGIVVEGRLSLGKHFDTSEVSVLGDMFDCAYLSDEFDIGQNFSMRNVWHDDDMFTECRLPYDRSVDEFENNVYVVDWLMSIVRGE